MFVSLMFCTNEEVPQRFIIIYTGANVEVSTQVETTMATVGMIVPEGTTIRTTDSTVDLQSERGHLIRIKEFTEFTLMRMEDDISTRVNIGNIYVRANRLDAGDEFVVVTPTAIAGVRGTTFSISVQSERSVVSTFDGAVIVHSHGESLLTSENERVVVENREQRLEEFNPSIREQMEVQTLINVDSPEEYSDRMSDALDGITIQGTPTGTIETLVMRDGTHIRGSVIGQYGSNVVILTPDGRQLNLHKEDIKEILF